MAPPVEHFGGLRVKFSLHLHSLLFQPNFSTLVEDCNPERNDYGPSYCTCKRSGGYLFRDSLSVTRAVTYRRRVVIAIAIYYLAYVIL
ncbi:uncharacterized protein G2W53_032742 [Senna tora]|uniref:Uncharacterized protein n=1 Tax=Senna tora TaxID=362788 RepID=A0A834SXU5_9FABA|nr:uncharacterized protein G2W53_032742 [Senna tora]